MTEPVVTMTPREYWTRWGIAGAVAAAIGATILYVVVTRPIVAAIHEAAVK